MVRQEGKEEYVAEGIARQVAERGDTNDDGESRQRHKLRILDRYMKED